MTTIAWDGTHLAADKMAVWGELRHPVTKIHRLRDGSLAGGSGELTFILAVIDWLNAGADPAAFPAHQRDEKDWQPVMRITTSGRIELYERTPYPVVSESRRFAIGSGKHYAIMAMHLGMTAKSAVEATSNFDPATGMGVDVLELHQPTKDLHQPA